METNAVCSRCFKLLQDLSFGHDGMFHTDACSYEHRVVIFPMLITARTHLHALTFVTNEGK